MQNGSENKINNTENGVAWGQWKININENQWILYQQKTNDNGRNEIFKQVSVRLIGWENMATVL